MVLGPFEGSLDGRRELQCYFDAGSVHGSVEPQFDRRIRFASARCRKGTHHHGRKTVIAQDRERPEHVESAMRLTCQATPATPTPLSPRAPIIPATAVPWY